MLNITRVFYLVSVLIVVSLALLAYEYFNMRRNSIRINEATQTLVRDTRLATQVRSYTDDLTNMARSYAATGNPRFKDHYEQIIAIKDGKQDRPAEYFNVHWDFLNAGHPVPNPETTPAQAFMDILKGKDVDFTEEELKIAEEFLQESAQLAEIERAAMKMADDGDRAGAIEAYREVLRLMKEDWGIVSGEEREAVERAIRKLQYSAG